MSPPSGLMAKADQACNLPNLFRSSIFLDLRRTGFGSGPQSIPDRAIQVILDKARKTPTLKDLMKLENVVHYVIQRNRFVQFFIDAYRSASNAGSNAGARIVSSGRQAMRWIGTTAAGVSTAIAGAKTYVGAGLATAGTGTTVLAGGAAVVVGAGVGYGIHASGAGKYIGTDQLGKKVAGDSFRIHGRPPEFARSFLYSLEEFMTKITFAK